MQAVTLNSRNMSRDDRSVRGSRHSAAPMLQDGGRTQLLAARENRRLVKLGTVKG